MILYIIIWQNFQSEILASNRHTSFILIQMIVLTMFGAKTWGWTSKWNFNYFTWNEIDIIIWQNFHSEILTSNHQTIWWNFQCEILAWNIVYLYSNDCLNHIWWKNLTMNFKINFFLIILYEISLDVLIWHNFHSEILALNLQTSFIIIQMIVFHEKWALMVIWALWHLEITFLPCIPVRRYQIIPKNP